MEKEKRQINIASEISRARHMFNNGQFEASEKICNTILLKDPNNINALNIFAGCLTRTMQIDQAIETMEKICMLKPNNAIFHSNLANVYNFGGLNSKAISSLSKAIINDPSNAHYQNDLSHLITNFVFNETTDNTSCIKKAIEICLNGKNVNNSSFARAWHSLLMLDFKFIKLTNLALNDNFKKQAHQLNIEDLVPALSDPFLLSGLSHLIVPNVAYEKLMTFLRRYFLYSDNYNPKTFRPFLCALAEQCNLNEYIYKFTREEQKKIENLEKNLNTSSPVDEISMEKIILLACYKNLEKTNYAGWISAASDTSKSHNFKRLIATCVNAPINARKFQTDIPSFSTIENITSSLVRQQYEENPYPRWNRLEIPILTEEQKEKGRGKKILTAGCGTGQEALNLAVHYPEAKIIGIDLSVASLAYGKQKSIELGINNVEFIHGDILEIEKLEQKFDMITCSGVLHHMEAPILAWRKLLTHLKTDGIIKIALYSEIARQHVALCRQMIKEKKLKATPEGISSFRQEIMALDDTNPLKKIEASNNFYSTSMCRDLVFHVKEHHFTLPQIKNILDDFDMHLIALKVRQHNAVKMYHSMYPDDPETKNLDNWHKFEQQYPDTFVGMYQFWSHKKGNKNQGQMPDWAIAT
jgi:2-polyprenyl-3-methyl-5-hydroxy-6-metoxy-1,4-benzoquinol methylase